MHARGQFVVANASLELGLPGIKLAALFVEPGEGFEVIALDAVRRGGLRPQVQDGGAARLHFDAAKLRRQPAVLPLRGAAAGVAVRIAEHDERGQVLVLGPQSVADPGAKGRSAREDLAGVDAAHRLRVIVVVAEHRADHAPVVGFAAHVRQ